MSHYKIHIILCKNYSLKVPGPVWYRKDMVLGSLGTIFSSHSWLPFITGAGGRTDPREAAAGGERQQPSLSQFYQ